MVFIINDSFSGVHNLPEMVVLVEATAIASMISPPFFHQRAMIETPGTVGIKILN